MIGSFLWLSHSAQTNPSENTISLKLNIPVIIDEILKTEYVREKMQDNYQEFIDKKTSINFGANYCKLEYADNRFRGTWENEYFPYDKIAVRGTVSEDHMLLESMGVEYQMNFEEDNRKESEIIFLGFENVPMYEGICRFDKAISKVELRDYHYSKTEIRQNFYVRTHKKTVKTIDYDEIPREPELASAKFRIHLRINGPPSYRIFVKDIRGLNPDWIPPLFSDSDKNVSTKPRSIAIYENSPLWIPNGSTNTITHYFRTLNSYLKVLERVEIEKLKQEHNLSASGLVSQSSLINNQLMKEEIALIIDYLPENKILRCTVASKIGEKRIDTLPITENNYGLALPSVCWEIKKAVDELLNNPGNED
ncbi:MAG: hypothetical protein ACP5D9_14395 [Mariniphaga sp.]